MPFVFPETVERPIFQPFSFDPVFPGFHTPGLLAFRPYDLSPIDLSQSWLLGCCVPALAFCIFRCASPKPKDTFGQLYRRRCRARTAAHRMDSTRADNAGEIGCRSTASRLCNEDEGARRSRARKYEYSI